MYAYIITTCIHVLEGSISSLPFPSSPPLYPLLPSPPSLPPPLLPPSSFPTPLLCLPLSPSSPLSLLSMPSTLLCVDIHVHLIFTRSFLSLSDCSPPPPHSTTPTPHHHITLPLILSFPSSSLYTGLCTTGVGLYVVWNIGVICTYVYRMQIPH